MAFPLYCDENAQALALVQMLRESGVDCETANDAAIAGTNDPDVLSYAAAVGRAVLTHDRGDFQRIHKEWMLAGRNHAGILIVTSSRIAIARRHAAIMRFHTERSAAQMVNAILFISPDPA